tara:strand:- start:16676 stop:18505 length:1830 start_codon:yes stop_codon:yes gene_type:complete
MLQIWQNHLANILKKVVVEFLARDHEGGEDIIQKINVLNSIEKPKNIENGDFSSNIAFKLAQIKRQNPTDIAQELGQKFRDLCLHKKFLIKNLPVWSKVEVKKPGFTNFFLTPEIRAETIALILDDPNFGNPHIPLKHRQKIILEFVSANPTGPLHVGHARQAVLGDTIANLLRVEGHSVYKEFYYNDAGKQIDNLGLSVFARLKGLNPEDKNFPTDGYKGEYISELAREFSKSYEREGFSKAKKKALSDSDLIDKIKKFAVASLRAEQNMDLGHLGVQFDNFVLESKFYSNGAIQEILDLIEKNGFSFVKDDAVWLKSSSFGDDKDRVMVKSDGSYTYFVPDVAYHLEKWRRGFDRAVNIQGSDHHGTLKRLKAGLQALKTNISENFPQTILHKMVRILKNDKEIKVSKRAGTYVTLRDLVFWASGKEEDVSLGGNSSSLRGVSLIKGRDAVRFFLLSKKAETEFSFDLDILKKTSEENPVFYIQYAHARAHSVIQQSGLSAAKMREVVHQPNFFPGKHLTSRAEVLLLNRLSEFPSVLKESITLLAPHVLIFYLKNLASDFHCFYNDCKILVENRDIKFARLLLVFSAALIIKRNLTLLGISAPKNM